MVRHTGQVVGYARVSSAGQKLDRQLEALGDVDKLFTDEMSGGERTRRAGLAQCIAYVRDGDTLRVASMDRLARSVRDLRDVVDELLAKGASVTFIKEGQTFTPNESDPMSALLLNLLGAVAEFERALIRDRQAEGIALAKKKGRYGKAKALSPVQIEAARRLAAEGVPKAKIARDFKVARATLYRALNGAE